MCNHCIHGLDFNGATRALNINGDREEFHRWCGRFVNLGKTHSKQMWTVFYKSFEAWAAWHDLHDTQQDALT
jgi:hypothetical protein